MKLSDLTLTQRAAVKLLSDVHPLSGRVGGPTRLEPEPDRFPGTVHVHPVTTRKLLDLELVTVRGPNVRLTDRGQQLALFGSLP